MLKNSEVTKNGFNIKLKNGTWESTIKHLKRTNSFLDNERGMYFKNKICAQIHDSHNISIYVESTGEKVLCLLWNSGRILYYEFLEPGQTVTAPISIMAHFNNIM